MGLCYSPQTTDALSWNWSWQVDVYTFKSRAPRMGRYQKKPHELRQWWFTTSSPPFQQRDFPACMLSRLSHIWLFATLWTVAHQAPLSRGFSRQESRNGLPCPPPEDLPDPGIKPTSPALQADSLPIEPLGKSPHHPLSNEPWWHVKWKNPVTER